MKDKEFTFWYPVVVIEQFAFREDGGKYIQKSDSLGDEGHILYQGRLMCEESMGVLKTRVGAKKHSIKKQRIADKKLCPVCQDKYKANEYSAWIQWARGEARKEGGVVRFWDAAKE